MSLFEALQADPESELIRQRIFRSVIDGMFPFDPGDIQVYTWYDIDRWRSTIKVVVERLPDYAFEHVLDYAKLVAYPDAFMDEFYWKTTQHFRHRPSLPVEDHILLGED